MKSEEVYQVNKAVREQIEALAMVGVIAVPLAETVYVGVEYNKVHLKKVAEDLGVSAESLLGKAKKEVIAEVKAEVKPIKLHSKNTKK